MNSSSSRLLQALAVSSLLLSLATPTLAATVKKPAIPARITFIKGYTPIMIGDYPNASLQVTIKNQNYTITAPAGTAVSNVSIPVNPKNKDLVYISTMSGGNKTAPSSAVYEYNLKNGKFKLLFSEKNSKRELRVAGIDGTNLILVAATQALDGCSSLWNGRYKLFTFDAQKSAKAVKAYTPSAALKKLGESEEQACKPVFGFKK